MSCSKNTKRFLNTRLALATALCVFTFITGCENGQIRTDAAERVVAGAVSGVSCRLAARKVLDLSSREANLFALACIAGSQLAMNRLVDRRAKHQSNEAFYTDETEQLKAYNLQLDKDIKAAQSKLAADKSEVERLTADAETASANASELESMQTKLGTRRSDLKKQLTTAEERRDDQKGVLAMMNSEVVDTTEAEKELMELEADIAELNEMVDDTEELTAAVGKSL